jgi:hypothetical protein
MKAYGKLSVPDALGQQFRHARRLLLAIGDDQFPKRRAKRRIGERIDVDAVQQGFGEGFADIIERSPPGVGGRKFAEGLGERSDHHETVYW